MRVSDTTHAAVEVLSSRRHNSRKTAPYRTYATVRLA
jgi:hypothetical protein